MVKGNEFEGHLEVGMRVHSILYGGRDGIIFKINGEQRPETIQELGGGSVVMGGSATIDVVFEKGTISYAIPESIIRGVQWYISDEDRATQWNIDHALAIAEATKKEEEKAREIKEAAKEEARQSFRAAHPELEPVDPKTYDSLKKGSRNLKVELREAFPDTKFSVRSESYSGGDSIHVAWTDGPTEEAVEKIADKYQEGNFNGMEDIYEYNSDNVWTDVFGGAKYVTCQRSYSPKAFHRAVAEIEKEYGITLKISQTEAGWPYISNEDDVNIEANDPYVQYGSRAVNQRLSETIY